MGYRTLKSFGADAALTLTPEGQKDPAVAATFALAAYMEAASKSGSYPGVRREEQFNQHVPADVADAFSLVYGAGPVPGSQKARGAASFDVVVGPEDAKTTADIGALVKSGYALLLERKFDPKLMTFVATKDVAEVRKLASSTGTHLVVSSPAPLDEERILEARIPPSMLNQKKKAAAAKPMFNLSAVEWVGVSAAAGALLVFLFRKK